MHLGGCHRRRSHVAPVANPSYRMGSIMTPAVGQSSCAFLFINDFGAGRPQGALCTQVSDPSGLGMFPHDMAFLSLPVAIFLGGALVMQLFARYQCQLALHLVALPVELERHTGVSLLLGAGENLGDLLLVQQQLAGS